MSIHSIRRQKRGFTLVEIIVVIAIITILLSIILAATSEARQAARDKRRVSDLSNINFALSLYSQQNQSYPVYPDGIEVGVGQSIDSVIAQYNKGTYVDPQSSGTSGSQYAYWYDSDFDCTQAGQTVLFAKTMEQPKNGNFAATCTDGDADTAVAGESTYIVVLRQ